MSEKPVFRTQDIKVGDKNVELAFKPVEEIFQFNKPPYIIIGSSTSGKTTLCIDLLLKYSQECTNIYYITTTEESVRDDTISLIPRVYRRKPKYEILYNVWREIKNSYDSTVKIDDVKLLNMLAKLIGSSNQTAIKSALEKRRDQIYNEQQARYTNMGLDIKDVVQYSKDDSKAFYFETLTRLILDFSQTKGTAGFSADEMQILNGLVSKAPRIMLLLDDVSSELEGLKRNKKKVQYEGQTVTASDAYKALLVDILTRGRHYNALICMFLHSVDLLQTKEYINHVVLLNAGAAQKVTAAKTFPEEMRNIIKIVSPYVFTDEFKYHFLYISALNNNCAVGCADLHFNEELQLDPMNSLFVKAYENIQAGADVSADVDNDEYEYGYEDEDVGADVDDFMKAIV